MNYEMNLDYRRLRDDLENYFGTAITNGYKQAIIDLVQVQTCPPMDLVQIAQNYGFDLNEYILE